MRSKLNCFVLVIVALLAISTRRVEAQNDKASEQFSKGYVQGLRLQDAGSASSPGSSSAGSAQRNKPSSDEPESMFPKKLDLGNKLIRSGKALELPSFEESQKKLAEIPANFVKVNSIGTILWAADLDHIKQNLLQLTQVTLEHKIPVSEAVLVTPQEMMVVVVMYINLAPTMAAMSGENLKKLLKLPGYIKQLQEYPEMFQRFLDMVKKQGLQSGDHSMTPEEKAKHFAQLQGRWRVLPWLPDAYAFLKYSPTYIVNTEYGSIVVEGTGKPFSHYFNKEGMFDLGTMKMFSDGQQVSTQQVNNVMNTKKQGGTK